MIIHHNTAATSLGSASADRIMKFSELPAAVLESYYQVPAGKRGGSARCCFCFSFFFWGGGIWLLPRLLQVSGYPSFSFLSFSFLFTEFGAQTFWADSPSSALLPLCLGEGSPTKIDYRESWYPYSNLSAGGSSFGCEQQV